MTDIADPAPPEVVPPMSTLGETTTLAVSYLRVSTKEQAERGGRDEGFSIPVQRQANLRYDGAHEALVSAEVWYRVQNVLTAHNISGEKPKPTSTTSKAPSTAATATHASSSPTPRTATATSTPYFICSGRHSKRTRL